MEKTIKAFIYYDGRYYCAKCMEIDVFTQGKTINETIENLREAVLLHLEDINPADYGLIKEPSLLIMLETDLQPTHA